jgi:hypothetical protein
VTYGSYSVSVQAIFAGGAKGAWRRIGHSFHGWSCSDLGTEYHSRFVSEGTPQLISTVTVRKLPRPRVSVSGQNTGWSQHGWSGNFVYSSVDARRQFALLNHMHFSVVDPKGNGNIMKGVTS